MPEVRVTTDLDIGKGFDPKVREALMATMGYAASQLRRVTPVDTGYLRSRWTVRLTDGSKLEMVNDAPYASYVENGTKKMKAQPMAKVVLPKVRRYYFERLGRR